MTLYAQHFVDRNHIIIAGVSRKGNKFGNSAVKELQKRGFTISIVHPTANAIDGLQCIRSCKEAGDSNAGLLVVLPPKNVPEVLKDAAAAGIKNVWLQQGAESPESITLAESLGLECVSGKCILMYAEEVEGIHKFHRTILHWFGKM